MENIISNQDKKGSVIGRYMGHTPWMALGKNVQGALTAEEAITAAGLNWGVTKAPLFTPAGAIGNPAGIQVNDRAVFRLDNFMHLGTVSEKYELLQNRDAFRFFDSVIGTKEASYHTAGSFNGGRRVWMLAKIPADVAVAGRDNLETYALLSNSHDGSSSIRLRLVTIRIVCQNTLTFVESLGRVFTSRHVGNLGAKVHDAQAFLGLTLKWKEKFQNETEFLVNRQFTDAQFTEYLSRLGFKFRPDMTEAEHGNMETRIETMKDLALNGKGNAEQDIRGSWWAAFNGVTEYIDHVKSFRNTDSHMDSLLFGAESSLKTRAYTEALNMADN